MLKRLMGFSDMKEVLRMFAKLAGLKKKEGTAI
jgi:hypothetical protein